MQEGGKTLRAAERRLCRLNITSISEVPRSRKKRKQFFSSYCLIKENISRKRDIFLELFYNRSFSYGNLHIRNLYLRNSG